MWSGKKTGVAVIEAESSLRRACHEFGRDDLYEPLRWLVSLKPLWLDANLQALLNAKRYVIAANVMLFHSRDIEAREYLQKAMRSITPDSARYRRLSTLLANLNVASKIARRSWELDGKIFAGS